QDFRRIAEDDRVVRDYAAHHRARSDHAVRADPGPGQDRAVRPEERVVSDFDAPEYVHLRMVFEQPWGGVVGHETGPGGDRDMVADVDQIRLGREQRGVDET